MNSPEHGILIERAVFPERLFAYRHIMPSEGIAARGRWGSSVFATPTLQLLVLRNRAQRVLSC